jgi:hypothetical protein
LDCSRGFRPKHRNFVVRQLRDMRKPTRKVHPTLVVLSAFVLLNLLAAGSCMGQSGQVFRLDGGDSTYVFGVNERGELQSLYWGGRLGAQDAVPATFSEASFPGGLGALLWK